MKIVCEICGKEYKYPFEQITHRHESLELDLVPPNFWRVEEYLHDFGVDPKSCEVTISNAIYTPIMKVGHTPLKQFKSKIYLKDESVNPTGSFKDRGMQLLMNDIINCGKKKVAVVSCGSGAISVIKFAKQYGLKSCVFVHKGIPNESMELIREADEVFFSENFIKSYEDYMKYVLETPEVYWGFLNTNISYMLGLRTLSYEIVAELGKAPDVLFLPCGSGMNIVAQNLAFTEMFENGLISKMPRICVVEHEGGNPIKTGFEKDIRDYLYIVDELGETKTILANDTCFNYKKITDMARRNEAFFISFNDAEIEKFLQEYPEYRERYDYTSLAVMAAMKKYNCSDELIVAVLTCRNRNGGAKI